RFPPALELARWRRRSLASLDRDRGLRPGGLRQFQLDRDPDRGDRWHCALAEERPFEARPARDDRRLAGRIHDGDDRGDPDMNMTETLAFLHERITRRPRVMLVLGSGLGALADHLEDAVRIPFAEIPGFAPATA